MSRRETLSDLLNLTDLIAKWRGNDDAEIVPRGSALDPCPLAGQVKEISQLDARQTELDGTPATLCGR